MDIYIQQHVYFEWAGMPDLMTETSKGKFIWKNSYLAFTEDLNLQMTGGISPKISRD